MARAQLRAGSAAIGAQLPKCDQLARLEPKSDPRVVGETTTAAIDELAEWAERNR